YVVEDGSGGGTVLMMVTVAVEVVFEGGGIVFMEVDGEWWFV
ncbi:hypothetical protein A2U01_0023070, partial [Trifolium medium]|nr:hypothetical protein [Trifolium medium]